MNRRKLLERIVQGFAAVGAGFVIYPFFKAGIPGNGATAGLEVELSDLRPGQAKLVHWLGRKVIVRRQSDAMLDYLERDANKLKDPKSKDSSQPDFARNTFRSRRPGVFVAFNNCTHLGCEVDVVNDTGVGFKCPCHQSDYDYSGRVMKGAAAPLNLEVPSYAYVSDNRLKLGMEEA